MRIIKERDRFEITHKELMTLLYNYIEKELGRKVDSLYIQQDTSNMETGSKWNVSGHLKDKE